jgi:hypothetical protein
VDRTTTFLDLHDLKYNSGACHTTGAYSLPVIREGKGESKGRTSVKVVERTLASSLPCNLKAAELVKRERRT